MTRGIAAPPPVCPEHLGPVVPRVADNSGRTATTVTTGDIIVQAPDAAPDAVARAAQRPAGTGSADGRLFNEG
ncbi:MAG: hypothetical protein K2O70_01150 [Desulfovibrionaceae bacterium]|nr:hypothetical protein [Desulfovibrionaceae bacterium]